MEGIINMTFNIKKPCADCPFIKGGHMLESLSDGRMEDILTDVFYKDGFFSCHKTVDYTSDISKLTPKSNFCAGALLALDKANLTNANLNTRLGRMLKVYDPKNLEGHDIVIEPTDYIKVPK